MKKTLIVLALAAAAAATYLYVEPQWGRSVLRQVRTALPNEQQTTLYKWQDADGRWQVTSERPAAGVHYEVLRYDHDTNVLPSLGETSKSR